MAALLSPVEFERKLLSTLRRNKKYKTITCHVQEVHADKWRAVYIYAPATLEASVFKKMDQRAYGIMRKLWPATLSRPQNGGGFGTDPTGMHFSIYWMPVPSGKKVPKFKMFYPATRSS